MSKAAIEKYKDNIIYNLCSYIDPDITLDMYEKIIDWEFIPLKNTRQMTLCVRTYKAFKYILINNHTDFNTNFLIKINEILSDDKITLIVYNEFTYEDQYDKLFSILFELNKEKDYLLKCAMLIKILTQNPFFLQFNLVTTLIFINGFLISNGIGLLNIETNDIPELRTNNVKVIYQKLKENILLFK